MVAKKKNPAVSKGKSSSKKNFMVKFHSFLSDQDLSYNTPMFYNESGQGWVTISSATKYSESGADKRILELLKEDKIVSIPMDVNEKPDNIFTLHTVFLDDGNVPQIITKVPQFPGDIYYLIPSHENWREEDLMDVLKEDRFTVLWDPVGSFVPEDNESWLNGLMGKS